MHSETTGQPQNLSEAEWQLLQLLATFSEPFYAEDVFLRQKSDTEVTTDNDTLRFYRHFHRIKNCGYLVIVPLEQHTEANNQTRPLYKLSDEGIYATRPKPKSVMVARFGGLFDNN